MWDYRVLLRLVLLGKRRRRVKPDTYTWNNNCFLGTSCNGSHHTWCGCETCNWLSDGKCPESGIVNTSASDGPTGVEEAESESFTWNNHCFRGTSCHGSHFTWCGCEECVSISDGPCMDENGFKPNTCAQDSCTGDYEGLCRAKCGARRVLWKEFGVRIESGV